MINFSIQGTKYKVNMFENNIHAFVRQSIIKLLPYLPIIYIVYDANFRNNHLSSKQSMYVYTRLKRDSKSQRQIISDTSFRNLSLNK